MAPKSDISKTRKAPTHRMVDKSPNGNKESEVSKSPNGNKESEVSKAPNGNKGSNGSKVSKVPKEVTILSLTDYLLCRNVVKNTLLARNVPHLSAKAHTLIKYSVLLPLIVEILQKAMPFATVNGVVADENGVVADDAYISLNPEHIQLALNSVQDTDVLYITEMKQPKNKCSQRHVKKEKYCVREEHVKGEKKLPPCLRDKDTGKIHFKLHSRKYDHSDPMLGAKKLTTNSRSAREKMDCTFLAEATLHRLIAELVRKIGDVEKVYIRAGVSDLFRSIIESRLYDIADAFGAQLSDNARTIIISKKEKATDGSGTRRVSESVPTSQRITLLNKDIYAFVMRKNKSLRPEKTIRSVLTAGDAGTVLEAISKAMRPTDRGGKHA